jgi:(E)-4-hydroxy-3-methylbut-2-enyl-diphosphate synthase
MAEETTPTRRATPTVTVGKVRIGGSHSIVIQSMTDTPTADVDKTVEQIHSLTLKGSEIVRLTVNDEKSAQAVPAIKKKLMAMGLDVPLVGDFHYNGHLLLSNHPKCAEALDKYRINPGNVGGKRRDENFKRIIEIAKHFNKPVRIGVNWGSLDKYLLEKIMNENASGPAPLDVREAMIEAMVKSALNSAEYARECGLSEEAIILSVKVSRVPDLIKVYIQLAKGCNYPLHVGLTEAGMGIPAIIASSTGLAVLLNQGIGDTIRVSLTPQPGSDRTEEVTVARQILQSLDLRRFYPQVTSCPGCGRTDRRLLQHMTEIVREHIQESMPEWSKKYPGVHKLDVAVMGCVVNGPGESRHADIGISLPGNTEEPKALVYVDGTHYLTLQGEDLAGQFINVLDEYVQRRFG